MPVALDKQRQTEQPGPTLRHCLVVESLRLFGVEANHHVVMIRHHRVGAHVDTEDIAEQLQPVDDPLLPVLIAAACESVPAAQERSADTA